MNLILKKIIDNKRVEIAGLKINQDQPYPLNDFKKALLSKTPAVIAELKKASPSRGLLRDDFDPVKIASSFQEKGAVALSVLTEQKYFLGSLQYLEDVKKQTQLPILRKDFIIDESQISESRAYGADAVLLIARILSEVQLCSFVERTLELGMHPFVEVHDEEDIAKALKSKSEIIGINNRDLDTFEIDLEVTDRLLPLIPDNIVTVMESGIFSRTDIHPDVQAILIGEGLINNEEEILQ